jgi:hypothetical protein
MSWPAARCSRRPWHERVSDGQWPKREAAGVRAAWRDLVVGNLTDYKRDPIEIPRQPRRGNPAFVWRQVKVAHLTTLWPGR